MKINTVLGEIESTDLGITLMHEHVAIINMNLALAFPGWYDKEGIIQKFCAEAEELKACGVKTFVDATPFTVGRDVTLLQECSRRSGMNILTCTGTYWAEKPWFTDGVDANYLADLMIREANEGIQGTGVKPAFIKCATGNAEGKSEINQAMIRAAGIAARETGLPVYTHGVDGGSAYFADYQKELLLKEGVDPARIAFGHICMLPSQPEIVSLLEGGSYIGYDQLCYYPIEMLGMVAQVLAGCRGTDVAKHMFFSCDALNETDLSRAFLPDHRDNSIDNSPTVNIQTGTRKRTLFERLVPMLKENGMSEDDVLDIFAGNPRRFFEGT